MIQGTGQGVLRARRPRRTGSAPPHCFPRWPRRPPAPTPNAQSNGFLTLLSDGEWLTGGYALGPGAGEWPQQATLAVTKDGLAAATRSLAVEYASRGIRVNAVSPGIIQTPAHPAESYAGLGGRLPPLGHVGQVSDVVAGILFLEASPFITGEILHVDGGQNAGH